ncbi:hypothetical protein CDAR_456971 [Caerostris darwini]|uniref:Uncharacterized protein n=1 Tax=Caerostris darwini TaxID=1538125 RepID=A0AAV4QKK2_9ARAC|nr:hypothetical protein CDAR_303231 [Caerostris darwini]GIY66556.1 hypothetical protein CDAR_456971 [Caerostris darwini]
MRDTITTNEECVGPPRRVHASRDLDQMTPCCCLGQSASIEDDLAQIDDNRIANVCENGFLSIGFFRNVFEAQGVRTFPIAEL